MTLVQQLALADSGGSTAWTEEAVAQSRATAIVAVAAGLMCIGAVMTFSASAAVDKPIHWWALWQSPAIRQLLFVGGGLLAMLITMQVPYRAWFAARGWPIFILCVASLLLLALVFAPGIGVRLNNARRWVQFGPVRFQPSELVKLALPMFLAYWMARQTDIRQFWRGLVPAVIVIGVFGAAVGLEDFGTAALLAAVAGAMLLVGGARIWHLALMVVPAIPATVYLLLSRSHRMERLMIFRDIWKDPEDKGYQAIQSLCAIANGGWWGRGLGRGFVKGYLPEARSDFIFSVICEEMGWIGAVAVIGLLMVLLWQGLAVVRRCEDPAGRLLAFGIVLMIGIQAAMNIAVVTVSVPTKGIALPLVSSGGSGVIFLGVLIGVLANIARQPGGRQEI